jgi:hypothetical protein
MTSLESSDKSLERGSEGARSEERGSEERGRGARARGPDGPTLGYSTSPSNLIGATGGGTSRSHRIPVFGFLLPDIGAGQAVIGANFSFTATDMRDHSSVTNPNLDFYALNTVNPETTGTDFFRQDNTPGANELFVGTFSVTRKNTTGAQESIASPNGDVSEGLTGPALTYLQSLYNPDGTPTQSEIFFRLNIDSNQGVAQLDRYVINVTSPALAIEAIPEPSSILLGSLACMGGLLRRRRMS